VRRQEWPPWTVDGELEKMKTRIYLAAPLLVLSLATATAASAQTAEKPAEQLGRVSFANSCAPAVQASFQRAVALLHSYWWREAEKTFRAVLERDPKCAIATWGVATLGTDAQATGEAFAARRDVPQRRADGCENG